MRKVIAVDGTAGVGKGTLCQRLARDLGWAYLDSGIFYRLLGREALRQGKVCEEALLDYLKNLHIEFQWQDEDYSLKVQGEALPLRALRDEKIAGMASQTAAIPAIREALSPCFRNFSMPQNLVCDGRDMGSLVFPDAVLKIYLSASVEVRAERRYKQLKTLGENASMAELVQSITERDRRDCERAYAPLKPASDAVCIDTSHASIEEVYQQVRALVEALPSSIFLT